MTAAFSFAELKEVKETLFPSRWVHYKGGYKVNPDAPVVTAVPEPDVADDECCGQIKAYVAEIQSCAAKFIKNRNTEKMEDLAGAVDSLAAFLMDFLVQPDRSVVADPAPASD